MTRTAILKRELGRVAAALDENLSDREMDEILAERRQGIEALLQEAREEESRGDEAPLEPLHAFLRAARPALVAIAAVLAFSTAAAPSASGFTRLRAFCSNDPMATCPQSNNASTPEAGLVRDGAGNLYGTTASGGIEGRGTIFELAFDGTDYIYKRLYTFCSKVQCLDGGSPGSAALILGSDGGLYGTTSYGGSNKGKRGTAFELMPNADRSQWTFVKLYDFCSDAPACTNGAYPEAGLTYAGQGSGALYDGTSPLFGTMSQGGSSNVGVVFKLVHVPDQAYRKQKVLHDFCPDGTGSHCPDGAYPYGIVADAHGNLFGVALGAGPLGDINEGTLFELVRKDSYAEQILHAFCQSNCWDGDHPRAAPIFGSHGNLLGTASGGGSGNGGVLYRYAPKSGRFKVLYSFCSQAACADGGVPIAGVVRDTRGNLFGTTDFGGSGYCSPDFPTCGTVYRWSMNGLTVLHSFCSWKGCRDGGNPLAGLILDTSGRYLFGTTSRYGPYGDEYSGGTAYKLHL